MRSTRADLATDADDTRAERGELRLVAAVLHCAVLDAQAGRRDARAWLASDESGPAVGGYFFIDVCAVLDVDPEWIRERAGQRSVRPRGARRGGRRFLRLEAAA